MLDQKACSIMAFTCLCAAAVTTGPGAAAGLAQSSSADYTFLVAAGFLCDPGDSATCPAVVKSANDDSYEMSGAGTFNAQSKSVTAAGTFTHKSSSGIVLETGVWTASELVSFDSFGIAPGALMRGGRAFGPPQFGPGRLRMFSGPMPAGGRAVFRIRLLPVWGGPKDAVLQVNCAIGKVPAEHQVEGIRLAFEGAGVEFIEEVSGRTLFVLTRPGASAASKPPAPEIDTNPAPAEVEQRIKATLLRFGAHVRPAPRTSRALSLCRSRRSGDWQPCRLAITPSNSTLAPYQTSSQSVKGSATWR